jgi:hypothetical protein
MNMTCLEQLHQEKRDNKANGRPFEASESEVEHPTRTVAQASTTLKGAC